MPSERKYPKRATAADKEKFQKACAMLDELGRKGFGLYLANENMHLMIGDSHGGRYGDVAQQHMSVDRFSITHAGGGDW